MLPLIERFLKALESERVVYCHWKSNAFAGRAADGEDDLDLLVSHASRQAFLGVLHGFGFKEALRPKGMPSIPGILDYYGYDQTVSRLIHVHVHYKLILGHDMNKNYHLPIENPYLESSIHGEFFRTPAPEFELAIFVIRMVLKHSTWNAILSGQGRLPNRERQELEYLQRKASRTQTVTILQEHMPFLRPELFDAGLRSLQPHCPLWVRLQAGEHVQKALHGCRIRAKRVDTWLQFWRRLVLAGKRRLRGNRPGKSMKSGGVLVAFVGGDGAGKTTVIQGISKWLFPPFATSIVHLGKPSWSLLTVLTRGALKIGRILRLAPSREFSIEVQDGANPAGFPGYPTLISAVCTARDRYLSYVKGRKQADKGVFVICDRFPLPRIISMDGPRIERMTGTSKDNRFIRFLHKLENRYYRSILPPDLLFVLRADPDTAVGRKSDEKAAFVRARSKEIWEKNWAGLAAHIIDANQPKTSVLEQVKALLWASL